MLKIIEITSAGVVAYLFTLFLIPAFKKVAVKFNLVDKPNQRKIHTNAIPLIGGISIATAVFLALLLNTNFIHFISLFAGMLGASLVLIITGILDDKFDLKAKHKLLIQISCAFAIASSGIRITSLYGIFGIHSIQLELQYFLTVFVITGVVNAFNLMDGIDGLAGGLSILGFVILIFLASVYSEYVKATIYTAFVGALIGFLRFNLNKDKIFMGDAGSLLLGFVLVTSGIDMLETAKNSEIIKPSITLFLIAGFFCVPVFDSLRVYIGRMKKGYSPFKADRSHLHHLFLLTGLTHKRITILINILIVFILLSASVLVYFFSQTLIMIMIAAVFYLIAKLLNMNKSLMEWKSKISKIENE